MKKFIYVSLLVTFLLIDEGVFGRSLRWKDKKECSCAGPVFGTPCATCPTAGKRSFPYETLPTNRRQEESQSIPDDDFNYIGRIIGEYLRLDDMRELVADYIDRNYQY